MQVLNSTGRLGRHLLGCFLKFIKMVVGIPVILEKEKEHFLCFIHLFLNASEIFVMILAL